MLCVGVCACRMRLAHSRSRRRMPIGGAPLALPPPKKSQSAIVDKRGASFVVDLADHVHDAEARVVDEALELRRIERAVVARFDVAVALDGEGDAVGVLAHHDV